MELNQKIFFGSKEDNNDRRLNEALSRTPHERFLFFLKLCEEIQRFSPNREHPNDVKNNFFIESHSKK